MCACAYTRRRDASHRPVTGRTVSPADDPFKGARVFTLPRRSVASGLISGC